jgi:GntR family transcriptional regulator, carbon starvation induced regulator
MSSATSPPDRIPIDAGRDARSLRAPPSINACMFGRGSTPAERAVDLIRRDLLSGALAPGVKLRADELCRRYGIGAAAIRKALSRLCSLELVQPIGHRGFRARSVSRADLEDIVINRQVVEVAAVRLSMVHGGADWEAGISETLRQLKTALERDPARLRVGDEEFDRCHRGVHLALLAGCGSWRLMAQAGVLYDQAYRYRRVSMQRIRRADEFYNEHATLAERVLRRDVKAACDHLARHVCGSLELVFADSGPTAFEQPDQNDRAECR